MIVSKTYYFVYCIFHARKICNFPNVVKCSVFENSVSNLSVTY